MRQRRRNALTLLAERGMWLPGAHGLSVLIETQKGENTYRQLFDTGPDSRSIVRNIEALKVQVGDIERVILSHW